MKCLVNLLTRQLVTPKHRARREEDNLKKQGERKKGEKKCHILSYKAQLIQSLCFKAET